MPPTCLCIEVSVPARLSIEVGLPGVRLTAAANALFVVYQDWGHQNPDIHMDGGINEDVKCQVRWKNLFVFTPNAMTYLLYSLVKYFLNIPAETDGI